VLIDAIAHLRDRGIFLSVSLVGDGPDAAELRAQVNRLGLDRVIRFCGALPTRKALAQGRLMVVPSRAESLPYVVLEGAACKPLIATRVGGIPEIFGPLADRLVAPNDPVALAEAISSFHESPIRAEKTMQELKSRIAKDFSLHTMIASVMGAYEKAAFRKQNVVAAANNAGTNASDKLISVSTSLK
jgi:glycosyltransferase involved in cell wall biosynthesis